MGLSFSVRSARRREPNRARHRARAAVWAAALALAVPPAVFAFDVPQGCDAPQENPNGRTFYIDPAQGSPDGDGSKARPWRRLDETLAAQAHRVATRAYLGGFENARGPQPINPKGSIKPGDTLVLMSGDHGQVDASGYVNADFIWVTAGPGQTPVIEGLVMRSSSHWVFKGIKFQGARPEAEKTGALVAIESHRWKGPADNVVFANDTFSTEDDVASWTPRDWVERPYLTGFYSAAACTSLLDSHLHHLRNAVLVTGDHTLVQDNLIENMGNDGVDMAASDVTIRRNRIQNGHHTPNEPLHADGVQGWSLNGTVNRHVVVDGNWVVNASLDKDNYMQGISIFSGSWDDLRVVNNVVINNTWNAISLYGVENAVVLNNTVLSAKPGTLANWIRVTAAKEGRPSRHVVVRNNLAPVLDVAGEDVAFDHNLAGQEIRLDSAPKGSFRIAHGTTGDHNSIEPTVLEDFVDFDLGKDKFDLRPSPASPARAAGSPNDMPPFDIKGRLRALPPDIGALAQ